MAKDINTLNLELENLKDSYHNTIKAIDEKRQEIAELLCPLKIGDEIIIIEGSKEITGIVDKIHYYISLVDQALNEKDGETSWQVSGKRINKTTGEVGKWRFSANIKFYDLSNKTFTRKETGNILFLGGWNDAN